MCRLWELLSCFTRSRPCPGCALEKTSPRFHPSGRREANCTTTASRVSLLKRCQREFAGGYWQMTWDWWETRTFTTNVYTVLHMCCDRSRHEQTQKFLHVFPGKDSDNHCSYPHQLPQGKASACGEKCTFFCGWMLHLQSPCHCSSLRSSLFVVHMQEEESSQTKAKTKPQMASKLKGDLW